MRKEPPKGNESPREKNHQWKRATKGKGPSKEKHTDGKESPREKEPPRETSHQGKRAAKGKEPLREHNHRRGKRHQWNKTPMGKTPREQNHHGKTPRGNNHRGKEPPRERAIKGNTFLFVRVTLASICFVPDDDLRCLFKIRTLLFGVTL